jgi:hypothetical protein
LGLCVAACLVVAACDDNDAPRANEPTPQSGVTPGEPVARAPENPDGLADTVARTLAAMLANGDQETMERYTADIQDRTGCAVQTSGVAYADSPKNRSLERRQRTELIEELLDRPSVTAVAHARRAVGRELPSTIGRGGEADVVGVVVALTCA